MPEIELGWHATLIGGIDNSPDSPFDRKRRTHGLPRDVANGPGRIRTEGYRKGNNNAPVPISLYPEDMELFD